ncbi:MAG: MerR family transcriptional regulator [bacterium]
MRKLYYSISETAEITGVPAHVLRYWESEFAPLSPHKGRTGNRLYQDKDLDLIRQIKTLLYDKKFTIAGAKAELAQKKLEEPASELVGVMKEGLQEILAILDDNTGRGAVR